MDLYGLAPWVGAGSFGDPYAVNPMFASWVWRATLLNLGLTCWSPTTGEMTTDESHLADMAQVLNSHRVILPTGSCAFTTCDAPEVFRKALDDSRGSELPFVEGSAEAFVAYARDQHAALLVRMEADFPTQDWTDPVTAAVEVIDTCRMGDSEAKRAWAYYAAVLTPGDPTPDGPTELYVTDEPPWRVNTQRVAQVLAVPDDTANYVWRAEMAYRTIVYHEAVVAFDGAGL